MCKCKVLDLVIATEQALSFAMLFYMRNHCCIADGVCVQSIEHPGCVWDAKFLDNGDIVTACSDGVVRFWTSQQDRIADPQYLESYVSQLSQYKLSRYGHAFINCQDFIHNYAPPFLNHLDFSTFFRSMLKWIL